MAYAAGRRTDTSLYAGPGIHQHMIEDRVRTELYRRAIEQAVKPGMRVLDIGCGSGILSYFAVRAGAEHVYTIEASGIADTAQRLFEANGVADRVTILRGYSTDIDVPQKADLLITETLGHLAIDEGILEITADAKQRFLTPNAEIVPGDVTVMVSGVNCPAFAREIGDFWNSCPFTYDLSLMRNEVLATPYVTSFGAFEHMTQTQSFAHWTMGDPADRGLVKTGDLDVIRTGTMTGIAGWFKSTLTQDIILEATECTHWLPVYFSLEEPLRVKEGDSLYVGLSFGTDGTRVTACSLGNEKTSPED